MEPLVKLPLTEREIAYGRDVVAAQIELDAASGHVHVWGEKTRQRWEAQSVDVDVSHCVCGARQKQFVEP